MFAMCNGSAHNISSSYDVLMQLIGWGVLPCSVVSGSGKDETKDLPENGYVWPVLEANHLGAN